MVIRETGYAKINLALHVRAREADGYHRIETLFAFCEDGDELTATSADGLEVAVEGMFCGELGAEEDNLVLRAARALAAYAGGEQGAAIRLDKRLPVASGIGGGSADAAAALRMLARLWNVEADDDALRRIAATLGADVPACVASRTARGDGRGDVLRPATGFAGRPVLLVNPGFPLSTGAVFGGWDGVDRGPMPDDPADARNDLQEPAVALCPAIGSVLGSLDAQPGATLVRMSGSGATCFALFEDEAARDAADAAIAATRPGWWRVASVLR